GPPRGLDRDRPAGGACLCRRRRRAGDRHARGERVRPGRDRRRPRYPRGGQADHLDPARGRKLMAQPWRGVIAEYFDRLPFTEGDPVVNLGEGGSPLVAAPALSAATGAEVYLKVEGANSTGSFNDGGMRVGMIMVLDVGTRSVE